MVPIVMVTANIGYKALCIGRVASRFEIVIAQLIIMRVVFNVTPCRFLSNVAVPAACSAIMAVVTVLFRGVLPGGWVWGLVAIPLSLATYLISMRVISKNMVTDSLATLGFKR